MILVDEAALGATGIASLWKYTQYSGSPALLAFILFLAASAALVALWMEETWWIVWLLLPQQFILFWSATGAVMAIYLSQFADGVVRPRAFISSDQIYGVLGAVGHFAAILSHVARTTSVKPLQ